jgi:cell division septum initiation protein DivIVA
MPLEIKEWEQLTQDLDQLVKNYEKLLDKTRRLEDEKIQLEKKLWASEKERLELRQMLSLGKEEAELSVQEMSTLKQLSSTVSRLLRNPETGRN